MEILLGLMIGVGLSAACGFRVFVPLLVVSLGAKTGHITLGQGFAWMGSWPALAAFSAATLVEVVGYLIPWVDHLLDMMALPLAGIAGTVLTAGMIQDVSPFLRYTLAIIAGGGVALATRGTLTVARAGLTATTAGVANPLLSVLEAIVSFIATGLALLVPVVAIAAVLLVFVILFRAVRRLRTRKRAEVDYSAF